MRDASPWDVLKISQYSQICLGLNFKFPSGKIWKLFHYPEYHFKPDKYQLKDWIQNNAGTRAGSEVKSVQNFTPPRMNTARGGGSAGMQKPAWGSCLCQSKGPRLLLLQEGCARAFSPLTAPFPLAVAVAGLWQRQSRQLPQQLRTLSMSRAGSANPIPFISGIESYTIPGARPIQCFESALGRK